MRRILGRTALMLAGLILALFCAELLVRLFQLDPAIPSELELKQFRQGGSDVASSFVVDSRMGFRPRIGYRPEEGRTVYSEYGALPNGYSLEKRPGIRRLLFVGDSVTARGRIIAALRSIYGEDSYEYWNAGVESFNTRQEVDFYRFYNAGIAPDHVILTFLFNDFQGTPVAFRDESGRLVVYAPGKSLRPVSRVFFRLSHLYRLFVGVTANFNPDRAQSVSEVGDALAELKEMTDPGIRLTVLILPALKSPGDWRPEELQARRDIVEIAARLGIRYFDLTPLLGAELKKGTQLSDSPRDRWHPSQPFAKAIADYLFGNGLFE